MFNYIRTHLQSKLVLSTILVVLIPTIIVSAYSLFRFEQSIMDSTRQSRLQAALAKAKAADSLLLERVSDVLLLSQSSELRRYVNAAQGLNTSAALNDVQHLFQSFLERSAGDYTSIAIWDVTGREVTKVTKQEDAAAKIVPESDLDDMFDHPSFAATIHLSAIRGQMVPVHFQQQTEENHGKNGPGTILLSTLIMRDDGVVSGILVLGISIEPILTFLATDAPGNIITVIDSTGRFIFQPHIESQKAATYTTDLKSLRPHDAQAIMANPSGVLIDSSDNPGYFQVFSRIKPLGQGTIQWTVIFEQPLTDILAPVRQTQWVILGLALLALLVALLVAVFSTKGIVKPVQQLARMAELVGKEQWETDLIKVNSQDEISTLATTFNNMTVKLKELLQKLKTSEKKYRSIFESALEGIYQATSSGRIISANPAAASILGFASPLELISSINILDDQFYVNPADRDTFVRSLRDKGEVNRFEVQVFQKDGNIIWAELSARAINDADGNFSLIEGLLADITPQKTAEKEQARLQAQLQQSQKMEALGNLAGGIAHDFNNLLQALSGYIQLLLIKHSAEEGDYKYLKEMDRAATKASDLVRRLLTFSRKMEVNYQTTSVNDIIQSTFNLLERTIPKMVTIETRLDPNLSLVQADPVQMEQVIMNLATNAVDAMDGSGILTIETENFPVTSVYKNKYLELQSGEYILIRFTDSGKGMDEETRMHVFEPFFTTKEPGKGTGLGLATVYGIVSNHKGQITCYSEPDLGTTFKIFLPVGQAIHVPEKVVMPPETILGGNETILLADDEEIILEIAEEILSQYGYTLKRVSSGEDALKVYAKNRDSIDLIVMDLGMPGMGGEKCLQELLKTNPQVKVLVASGYAAHRIAQEPQKYGAAGFISKPYRLNQLAARVREVLDQVA